MHISGSLFHLSDLETILLQKLGPACVAAFNAFTMCSDLPRVAFLAMDARHCAGLEMAEIMAYAASVGSNRARRKVSAVGFIGNATHATAHYFGQDQAMGTMPHALIGFPARPCARPRCSTRLSRPADDRAGRLFGREVTDGRRRAASRLASRGKLAVRIDAGRPLHPGARSVGLPTVLDRNVPDAIRGYHGETELRHLVGAGVSPPPRSGTCASPQPRGLQKVRSSLPPSTHQVQGHGRRPTRRLTSSAPAPSRRTLGPKLTHRRHHRIQRVKRVKIGREFLFRK
jgi:nicotinate phosphoribosyltransferase